LRYNFATDRFYMMLIFALDKLNIRHISTSGLVDHSDLECVSRDAYLTIKVSTKFKVDTTIRCLVRRTDGIAVASTALAMRALWRAAKID